MLFLLLFACGEKEEDTALSLCVHDPPLSYENFGKSYMDMHCTGCHGSELPPGHRVGAPLSVNLDSYDLVLDWADRIEARSTYAFSDTISMPPGGGPTEDEILLLEEWLYCAVLPQKEIRDSE